MAKPVNEKHKKEIREAKSQLIQKIIEVSKGIGWSKSAIEWATAYKILREAEKEKV